MISGPRFSTIPNRQVVDKLKFTLQLVLFGLSACFISTAHAVKQGHGRLVSTPGNPLEITLPITDLTAEDLRLLKVEVASPALWTQSGLTPPVALDQLRVSTKPGFRPDGRFILVQSTQPSNREVVDLLLTISTASGSRQLQVSLLQPEFATVQLASSRTSVKVLPGDTLYGIAQRNLVPGATIHQMLWALYEANPGAFISQNMNLLRAGAVLNIPDAKTVLAIDPAMARHRFAEHDSRFRAMRGKRVGATGQPPVVAAEPVAAGKVTPRSQQPADKQSAEDRLRLSTSPQDREADQQASRKKDIAENQARVGELQQNIHQMQQALGQTAGSGSVASGAVAATTGSSAAAGSITASGSNAAAGGTNAQAGAVSSASGSQHTGMTSGTSPSSPAAGLGAASPASAVSSADSTASSGASASTAGEQAGTARDAAAGSGGQAAASGSSGTSGQESQPLREQKDSNVVLQWVKDNLLVVLPAILAIVAFLIGMRMRRDSSRRDDETDDPDAGEVSPAAQQAFEKKLQSIDLNLDSTEATSGEPKKPTP